MHLSRRVVLTLVMDILFHPIEVSGPEGNHAVAGLPLQYFAPQAELLVDVVR